MLYYRQGVGGDRPINNECSVSNACNSVKACKRGGVGSDKPNIVNVSKPPKTNNSSYYSPMMNKGHSKNSANVPNVLTNLQQQNIDGKLMQ